MLLKRCYIYIYAMMALKECLIYLVMIHYILNLMNSTRIPNENTYRV